MMKNNCISFLFLLVTAFLLDSIIAKPAHAGSQGVWEEECYCYRDIDYGPISWQAVINRSGTLKDLKQDFDFFPVDIAQKKQPLIIWAHPALMSKTMPVVSTPTGSSMWEKIVLPARAAGFAVASIEYRHPVDDDNIIPADEPIPHEDALKALQWIRGHAIQLGIDKDNIFFMGHSRGTLVVWSGLQDDRADPTSALFIKRQSTRVNAIYSYNTQATYDGIQVANTFIVDEGTERADFIDTYLTDHPRNDEFGSHLDSITRDDPPLMSRHELPYFNRLVYDEELGKHHPDYGLALCAQYTKVGIGDKCTTIDRIPGDVAYSDVVIGGKKYDGFVNFFKKHLKK